MPEISFIDLVLKPEFLRVVGASKNGEFDLTEKPTPKVVNGLRHDFLDETLNLLWLHWQHAAKISLSVSSSMFDIYKKESEK